MTTIFGILIGILLLSLMMFIHEMGHYLVGKKLGFTIVEFSIFMGPRLISWEKKGIRYSLKSIPLGASVQFAGEYNGDPKGLEEAKQNGYVPKEGDFYARPAWQRICVAFAGPIFNIVTALLAFALYFSIWGMQEPVVAKIDPGTVAARYLEVSDKILKINGQAVHTGLDIQSSLLRHQDGPLQVDLLRNDQEISLNLDFKKLPKYFLGIRLQEAAEGLLVQEVTREDLPSLSDSSKLIAGDLLLAVDQEKITYAGLQQKMAQFVPADDPKLNLTVLRDGAKLELLVPLLVKEVREPLGIVWKESHSVWRALPYAVRNSVSVVRLTFGAIGDLFTGKAKPKETLSGPIGVVSTISGAVTAADMLWFERLASLLMLFALVSLSLGMMNLLPIPPLDGSLIVMSTLEWIRGKPLSAKVQGVVTVLGLLIIAALFIIGFYADLSRLLF